MNFLLTEEGDRLFRPKSYFGLNSKEHSLYIYSKLFTNTYVFVFSLRVCSASLIDRIEHSSERAWTRLSETAGAAFFRVQ